MDYLGKEWGELRTEEQQHLLKKCSVWEDVKEGHCIIDLTENLSIGGYILEDEILINDEAVIYNPEEGIIKDYLIELLEKKHLTDYELEYIEYHPDVESCTFEGLEFGHGGNNLYHVILNTKNNITHSVTTKREA